MRSLFPENVEKYVESLSTVHADRPRAPPARAKRRRLQWGGMQIGAGPGRVLRAARALDRRAARARDRHVHRLQRARGRRSRCPPTGSSSCCDVSDEWTQIARRYWREAGVADRIDLRLAPADGHAGERCSRDRRSPDSFDFAFVDADKTGYDGYYEALPDAGAARRPDRVRQHAVERRGRRSRTQSDARHDGAARAQRQGRATDPRVDACLLTVGDGVLLALKH